MFKTWLIICPSCASIPPDFPRTLLQTQTTRKEGREGGREGETEGGDKKRTYLHIQDLVDHLPFLCFNPA
jgi:hypothetical protein